MIKKFVTIKNLGCFKNFSCSGDVELKKLNIIYAPNGVGKTTLTSLLRSLKTANTLEIKGRKTLGAQEKPFATVLIHSGVAQLQDYKWSQTLPFLEIFDETFVRENVHSGDCVEHSQKKSLCSFVLGEANVRLKNIIDKQAKKVNEINSEISSLDKQIFSTIESKFTVENYCSLEPEEGVDVKISKADGELRRANAAKQIQEKDLLQELQLPAFDIEEFKTTLEGSIESISASAEEKVNKHIKDRLDEDGRDWLNKGLNYLKGDQCPFCGSNVRSSELIQLYRQYFSDEYKKHKESISNYCQGIQSGFSDQVLLNIQTQMEKNKDLGEFWDDHLESKFSPPNLANYHSVANSLKSEIIKILQKKELSPVDIIKSDLSTNKAIKEYESMVNQSKQYNETVSSANVEIKELKARTQELDAELLKESLDKLKLMKKRFDGAVKELCEKYNKLNSVKLRITDLKEENKKELSKNTAELLDKYGMKVNTCLRKFGVRFSIELAEKPSFVGGTTSTDYKILINECLVELGKRDSPLDQTVFRNTLSSGDKTTLAFSLFVARLLDDPKLADKVLVFDDPITSLDTDRRASTAMEIIRFASACKQVIVLTHDLSFARLIWEQGRAYKMKELCIEIKGTTSGIASWDLEENTASQYILDYRELRSFLTDPSADRIDTIRPKIRKLLEAYLILRFPDEFTQRLYLRDMIGKIRNASKPPLKNLQALLPELEDMNNYSNPSHHQDVSSAHITTTGELAAFVRRALDFVTR